LELIDPTGDFDFDSDFKNYAPKLSCGQSKWCGFGFVLAFLRSGSFVSFHFHFSWKKNSFPVFATFTVRPLPGEKRANPLFFTVIPSSFSSIRITLLASRHRLDSFVMLSWGPV
jgi:hypothetical protein